MLAYKHTLTHIHMHTHTHTFDLPLCPPVLTDTQDTSPHPSEEMLSSQSELRSSKCPQDRELPSIPPNSALEGMIGGSGDDPPATGEGTYEVRGRTAGSLADFLDEKRKKYEKRQYCTYFSIFKCVISA